MVDGYYDYHHYNGKKYPFYIRMKNEKPFTMAGLWAIEEFPNEEIVKKTATIVTCDPNSMMAKIHNNPASSDEPRMPVILPKELEREWLSPYNDDLDKQALMDLIKPYPEGEMVAHTVHRLTGKESVGNTGEKIEEFVYGDLEYPVYLRMNFWEWLNDLLKYLRISSFWIVFLSFFCDIKWGKCVCAN